MRKTKDLIESLLYFLKFTADLPAGGELTSVETALNSRCTSDDDGNPETFHWGIFDRTKKLSDEQIRKIIDLARIPRFTDQKAQIQSDRNMLTFIVQRRCSGVLKDWIMVESGMQQQAVGLVCAALGVGMIFRNLGVDGIPISASDHANIRVQLDPMRPSYGGSFWSRSAPAGEKSWVTENLSDPVRDGHNSLISTLKELKTEKRNGKESTDEKVSQLLWAARGRTPHFYKSRPWGITIPTCAGKQNVTSVYLLSDKKLFRYINWDHGRPTHSLSMLHRVNDRLIKEFNEVQYPNHTFIILGKNEYPTISLWEVGYQLLNLLVQAHSLGISYQASLLDETQRATVSTMGVKNPVAMFTI
jgi:hypothetical protein